MRKSEARVVRAEKSTATKRYVDQRCVNSRTDANSEKKKAQTGQRKIRQGGESGVMAGESGDSIAGEGEVM